MNFIAPGKGFSLLICICCLASLGSASEVDDTKESSFLRMKRKEANTNTVGELTDHKPQHEQEPRIESTISSKHSTEPTAQDPKSDTPAATDTPRRLPPREAHRPRPPSRSTKRVTQEAPPIPESPQEEETRLTKNWGGSRKALSDKGVDIALIYKGESTFTVGGGLNRRSSYEDNVDLRINFNIEKMIPWKGASAFLYILSNHGGHPSRNVGDYMKTSNIEVPVDSIKVYEAWFQQLLYDEKLSFLFGLHDLNSEFYSTDSSSGFFHSSFGVGAELAQTGPNGPSIFPTTAPALRIRTEPSKSFYLQWAAFNARAGNIDNPNRGSHFRLSASDGLLLIAEMAYTRGRDDATQLPAKYGIGYWAYTRTFDHLTETISTDPSNSDSKVAVKQTSRGIYFLVDQSFHEKFSAFFRYGAASSEVNQIRFNIGTGVLFKGIIPFRPKDRIGLAMSHAEAGNEYLQSQTSAGVSVKAAETAFEFNYRFEAIPGVALQPDFQYIRYPNFNPGTHHASVIAFRFELNF